MTARQQAVPQRDDADGRVTWALAVELVECVAFALLVMACLDAGAVWMLGGGR